VLDDQRRQALSAISPFAGLPDAQRCEIADRATWVQIDAGRELVSMGDAQEVVWAVVEGVARGCQGGDLVADFGPGQLIAELGTLDRRSWTMTVRARTPVTAVRVPRGDLDAVLADPVLAWELIVAIASTHPAHRPGEVHRRPVRLRHPEVLRILTPAEQRVADLVADGHTNQEVADRLYLSRLTVETHLKRIFAKLGIRSRAALAAAVVAGLR
jgi:DNA-binding CsgD family transcriptional regulator